MRLRSVVWENNLFVSVKQSCAGMTGQSHGKAQLLFSYREWRSNIARTAWNGVQRRPTAGVHGTQEKRVWKWTCMRKSAFNCKNSLIRRLNIIQQRISSNVSSAFGSKEYCHTSPHLKSIQGILLQPEFLTFSPYMQDSIRLMQKMLQFLWKKHSFLSAFILTACMKEHNCLSRQKRCSFALPTP